MHETYVRLVCPECSKDWESDPADLPAAERSHECPDCEASRPTAEYMRTDHDLETLKQFG